MPQPIMFGGGSPWAPALAAIFGGLSAAGQPGGWSNFGTGAQMGQQNFQQGQQNQQAMHLRQMQIEQAEAEARRANQEEAQRQAKLKLIQDALAGSAGSPTPAQPHGNYGAATGGIQTASGVPGQSALLAGMSPQQSALFSTYAQVDPEAAFQMLAENVFAEPERDKWEVKTVREGGEEVTYQINPYTGDRVELGRGPAFAPQAGGDSGVGLELFYTQDADGTLHAWQPSRNGQPVEVKLPEGQKFSPGVQYLNTGTAFVPADKRSGQVVGDAVPIDVAGQNAQQEIGTATGKVAAGLPDAVAKAEEATTLIESLKTHPGRQYATGLSSYLPQLAGTDAKDFNVKLERLKGTVFLQAYSQLKGGGAITEIEGQKAEQAIASLSTAQSEGEFVKSLDELKGVINAGIARMKQRAGQPVATPENKAGSVPPPPPGFVVQGQ